MEDNSGNSQYLGTLPPILYLAKGSESVATHCTPLEDTLSDLELNREQPKTEDGYRPPGNPQNVQYCPSSEPAVNVGSLPNEILLEIFRLIIFSHHSSYAHLSTHGSEFSSTVRLTTEPWDLSQVCSRWKFLVRNSPEFWTRVVCIIPEFAAPDSVHLARYRIQEHLHNAKDQKVHLHIDISAQHTSLSLLASITKTILAHSRCWETAYLHLRQDVAELCNEDDFRQADFPELKSLVWKCYEYDDIHMKNIVINNAPRLTTLELDSLNILTVSFPWTQITRLAISSFYGHGDVLLRILAQCAPNLTSLSLGCKDGRSRGIDMSFMVSEFGHISFPQLRTLKLSGGSPTRLLFPELRTLVWEGFGNADIEYPFVRFSRCSSVINCTVIGLNYALDLPHLLGTMPDLRALHLVLSNTKPNHRRRQSQALLKALSSTDDDLGSVGQQLDELTLSNVVLNVPGIVRLLDFRQGGLRKLRLIGCVLDVKTTWKDIHLGLSHWCQVGLTLDIE